MAKKKAVAVELKAPAVKGLLRDVPDPTVYLNGVLRFDDDHIIRVKYDPTSKAMVIDDVPQSLESSITLGEGGGGIANPLISVKAINNSTVADSAFDGMCLEDGKIVLAPTSVGISETLDVDVLAVYFDGISSYAWFLPMDTTSTADLVNVTVSDGALIVTDPTLPASATVNLN